VAGARNTALARKWLTLAAERGSADAKATLAKLDADENRTPVTAATGEPGVAQATRSAPEGVRREAWVLAQPAQHYTIQLMAAQSEAQARDFIQQQGLANRAAYFETAGTAVVRVVLGSYASRELADKALAALPRPLSANAPWVRTFGELHKLVDLQAAQRGVR
jgi:DamX protein